MAGRTLSVLGLGNVGRAVAQIGNAFGIKVIAWSQNLTTERAAKVGATLVSKDKLFQEADIATVHLVLSGRTRGLVGVAELARWQRDPGCGIDSEVAVPIDIHEPIEHVNRDYCHDRQ
jgi:phosphoglycerate dehydrogenase-like enzyme